MNEEKAEKMLRNAEQTLTKTENLMAGEQDVPREWFQTKQER
jgi:hypothetical protein